jgi:uncharacterized protein (TIGR00375 family)
MKLFTYLHIHSKYAYACSDNLTLEELSRFAKMKGLGLLSTGDFTHPKWLEELKQKLKSNDRGFFEFGGVHWVLGTEVSNIYRQDGKVRKIHHLLYAPSFDIVNQVNELLARKGKLASDGRPTVMMSSQEMVEALMQISRDILIVPAHAWTPWFGVFGSKSGFDSLRECYGELTKHIHGIETGLSSDPAMNWRLPELDGKAILSNSDCHSPWPWRLGREANAFDIQPSYSDLFEAIKTQDPNRFLFTIEVDPSYGKYHFDGHRECGVRLHPSRSAKLNNICPSCSKSVTIGVLNRLESLAQRPEGFKTERVPFHSLLPLAELVGLAFKTELLTSKKVLTEYYKLVQKFGNEFQVLMNTDAADLREVTTEQIAQLILLNRTQKIEVVPGYDGAYGVPLLPKN